MSEQTYEGSVAIVGMAGRFPGAADVEALWANLLAGRQAIRPLTEQELTAVDPAVRRNPRFVPVTAPVADVDRWDAGFFGFSPREAELIDPQHRLFLECAWEALEDAGYDPRRCPGVVGVFAGCGFPTYLLNNLAPHRAMIDEIGYMQVGIGNDRDTLTTMASYRLDLRGPSAAVQTACSTSLVATHMACQSLLTHESDVMLAGGAALHIPQAAGYVYEEGGLMAPDGVFRSLDAKSQGRVVGNGAAVVALKRTADAVADGDHIYATIAGSAMNNDGVSRVGFAAPGVRGQAEVMVEALSCADVSPDDISYVEAHGTGTVLGDSVELEAVSRGLASRDRGAGPCVIGSLKANIGHLDRAAGVTGVIKAALMLRDARIPPQINFDTPNPNLDPSRFEVITESTEWPPGARPRRALVNAFGLGGTNAAVVVQEAPRVHTPREEAEAPQLLVLSARSPAALERVTSRLCEHLRRHAELDMADVAFTLQTGRTPFNHRRTLVCHGRDDAIAVLSDPASARIRTAHQTHHGRRLTIVVPDGPAPGPAATEALLESEPAFRIAYERYAAAMGPAGGGAFRYALGSLLQSWGLRPELIVGAGSGAHVAACLNGSATPERSASVPAIDLPPDVLADGDGVTVELGDGALLGTTNAVALAATSAVEPRAALAELAGRLWLAGVDVDLAALHIGRPRRRVPLPTYPFERQRFWIDPPARAAADGERGAEHWFTAPVWRQAPRIVPPDLEQRLVAAGPWLIAGGTPSVSTALAGRLREAGAEVHIAAAGTGLAAPAPRTVIHAGSPPESPPDVCIRDVAGLVRALGRPPATVRMLLLTRAGAGVHPDERVRPAQAAVIGLARVIPQEHEGLACGVVDLGDTEIDAVVEAVLGDALEPDGAVVAYRGAERWSEEHSSLTLAGPTSPGMLREHGVYLITGGLGEVGLALAEHLARRCRARLALLSRSGLPPRAEWDAWPADHATADRTSRRIQCVRAVEAAGAEVMIIEADVGDVAQVSAARAAVRERFGDLHGVIHGAAIQSVDAFGAVEDVDATQARQHLRPKLAGLAALAEAIDLDRLDFCVTLSSLASVLGAVGHGAYAAANAAMDGQAHALFAAGHRRVLSIDWDAWPNSASRGPLARPLSGRGMSYADGAAALERALGAVGRLPRLVHSTSDLGPRLTARVAPPAVPVVTTRHPRPPISARLVEPGDDVEVAVAEVWQDVLGLREVGVLDPFVELGGDSLMALRVIAGVREALGIWVPVATFAACRTVRELTDSVKGLSTDNAPTRIGGSACNA
jgi:acyl transferase domain-containing protein/acyl carrier protein